jgi:bacillithiol system protein YtxJ
MNWIELKNLTQLEQLREESKEKTVLIFKHSTSCSISKTALSRLERNWNEQELPPVAPYYLDLLSFRPISNSIATSFDVEHQSPQVLIIKNGESVYDKSHFDIDYQSIKVSLQKIAEAKN